MLGGNNIKGIVTIGSVWGETCQVGMAETGVAMEAGLVELQRHRDMPSWPQPPHEPGIPDGQQHWPETMPTPAP
jgi:hypothetical protein